MPLAPIAPLPETKTSGKALSGLPITALIVAESNAETVIPLLKLPVTATLSRISKFMTVPSPVAAALIPTPFPLAITASLIKTFCSKPG